MTNYKIYSWNVNGIRAAVRKGIDEWIVKTDLDILCLQEIKATEKQIPDKLKSLSNYEMTVHSAERKGYSGVATIYRNNKSPKVIDISMGHKEFDAEGRLIKTEYPEFTLFNVYFPNGKKNKSRLDYKMRFYDRFLEICQQLLDQGKNVVVCGDVNTAHKKIDLEHPKPNSKYSGFLPKERAWIDKFLATGFVDSLRFIEGDTTKRYTWWTYRSPTARKKNVGWRLDYFFISEGLKSQLRSADIHPDIMGSDHCPISIELQFP